MNKTALFILCILTVVVISGCATEQGSSSAYNYERPSSSHAGHHH